MRNIRLRPKLDLIHSRLAVNQIIFKKTFPFNSIEISHNFTNINGLKLDVNSKIIIEGVLGTNKEIG